MESKARNFGAGILPLALALLLTASASGQVNQRVSVSSTGGQLTEWSFGTSISRDGRYVGFMSYAPHTVPGDDNGNWDAFVRDRRNGTTEIVSVDSYGLPGNNQSSGPWLSPDGRFAAFVSYATNLVPGDTNAMEDAFLHDRETGITELISVGANGVHANADSGGGEVTPGGRYVRFTSYATNLLPAATNGRGQVFLRDRETQTTELVSVNAYGQEGDNSSGGTSITDDGRYVLFLSDAWNLIGSNPTPQSADLYLRDRVAGTTTLASLDMYGHAVQGTWLDEFWGVISGDGRYVAMQTNAATMVPGDSNGFEDIFVRDRASGQIDAVTVAWNGGLANDDCYLDSISPDGRFVAFETAATNLVAGVSGHHYRCYVRDRIRGTTELVSVSGGGVPLDAQDALVSADGRYVTFDSNSSQAVPGDSNGIQDTFVRDRFGGPDFESLCDPGVGGVRACPCQNPPSSIERGCDNSAGTGGARLAASGGTWLSSDGLLLTAEGVRPDGLCILLQGTQPVASGAVYGQGVRCAGGTIERLFAKQAVGDRFTAPNFPAGDPPISVRSRELGDEIHAGKRRWYVVAYRDPIVLGRCVSSSTFNATQTGVVTWAP